MSYLSDFFKVFLKSISDNLVIGCLILGFRRLSTLITNLPPKILKLENPQIHGSVKSINQRYECL